MRRGQRVIVHAHALAVRPLHLAQQARSIPGIAPGALERVLLRQVAVGVMGVVDAIRLAQAPARAAAPVSPPRLAVVSFL
ncbi:hypothetical protein BON30_11355 [Cystobacter ferrugineus]|uniref:Uncharacterized protein n=1 Tax=Cystobacter ferrugineus TaxID=83449 RepID=A0A1L9BGM5_9BACT|nr:hypothetical protein BON30_11355 [Cystobacter ferrugineus]